MNIHTSVYTSHGSRAVGRRATAGPKIERARVLAAVG